MSPQIKEGLDLLINEKKLGLDDWKLLLGERKARINPFLDKITLRKIKDVDCFFGKPGIICSLADFDPVVTSESEKVSLETQGIFFCFSPEDKGNDSKENGDGDNGKKKYIWGLSRNGDWVLTEIELLISSISRKELCFNEPIYYEEPTKVKIYQEGDVGALMGILSVDPKEMYLALGKVFKDWTASWEIKYNQIVLISHGMNVEDEVMRRRSQ